MTGPQDPRLAVLCHLDKLFPIKVEGSELEEFFAGEGRDLKDLPDILAGLSDEGLVLIEETVPPFSTEKKRRYGLTEKGRDVIRSAKVDSPECINPREIESQLISAYDSMKQELEGMREGLENDQRVIEGEMAKMRKTIADHDQFLKTYFVRIMESIGVFIGVFGIVVVMMVTNLKDNLFASDTDASVYLAFVVTLPLLLVLTIIPGMWLVKRLILDPD